MVEAEDPATLWNHTCPHCLHIFVSQASLVDAARKRTSYLLGERVPQEVPDSKCGVCGALVSPSSFRIGEKEYWEDYDRHRTENSSEILSDPSWLPIRALIPPRYKPGRIPVSLKAAFQIAKFAYRGRNVVEG